MGKFYAESTIDVVGDLHNGLHVETSVYDVATYWDGAGGPTQLELFNVFGRILLLQLFCEMTVIQGGGATLVRFNATFATPPVAVQPISAVSASVAGLAVGSRVVWQGGDITSVPIVPVDGMLTTGSLGIGAVNTAVANGTFAFFIAGAEYSKAAIPAGTAPGNDVIPINLYGAVAFDIGIDGTIDIIEAGANAAGYASAVLAIAGIAAVGAGHIRIGTVTAMRTVGAFTFGTTALDDADSTVAYIDTALVAANYGLSDIFPPARQIIGTVGGIGTIGHVPSVADSVSGSARANLFYMPLSDNAYVTAAF